MATKTVIVRRRVEFEAMPVAVSNWMLANCPGVNYFDGDAGSDDQLSSGHSFLVDCYY